MRSGQALGYGLLAGAAVVSLLLLAWLAVAGVQAGGFVLGLLLLVVLAGPMAGAGWYLLARGRTEAAEETRFAGKRRIIEADRLFRQELAAELRQLARRAALPSVRVEEMAEDLERRAYDRPEWYEAVELDDGDLAVLRRYDDLVWERTRRLRTLADAADVAPEPVAEAVRELERALDQRRDLLLRGRRAPAVAASALLRAGEPARGADALARLKLGDAVTYEGDDYVVESVASYFAEGRTWKLAHLEPSGPGPDPRWLYVGPEAMTVGLLADHASSDGARPPTEAGSASVDVDSRSGSARGLLVAYRLYRTGGRLELVEEWPDGVVHSYAGPAVRPAELEVWPGAPLA